MAEFNRTSLGYGYQRYEGYGYFIEDGYKKVFDDIWGKHYVDTRYWRVICKDGTPCGVSFRHLTDAKKWCRENPR